MYSLMCVYIYIYMYMYMYMHIHIYIYIYIYIHTYLVRHGNVLVVFVTVSIGETRGPAAAGNHTKTNDGNHKKGSLPRRKP